MNREIRTPDEIKKGIDELEKLRALMTFDPSTGEDIDPFFLNEENRQLYEGVGFVLQYIQQLEAEVRDIKTNHQFTIGIAKRQKNQIARLKAACVKLNRMNFSRWISNRDSLPPLFQYVLLFAINKKYGYIKQFCGNRYTPIGCFDDSRWLWSLDTDEWEITHWMPLPEPPKE